MEKLAIVIPAYKATFLRDTLDSIAAQTDKRFHLYIGDDCSPENIEEIVDEFKSRIPLTYKRFDSNIGGDDLVAQWERCIAMTNDEQWLWLFSDDDTMDKTCVAAFYNAMKVFPHNELFRFNVDVVDDYGKVLRKIIYPSFLSSQELYLKKIRGTIECFVVEYIFKRETYVRENGFVKFDLAWGSDLATWVKFGMRTGIRTIEGCPGVRWRSSGINISTIVKPEIIKRKIIALTECLKWGEREFPGRLTKKVNQRGLVSRLSRLCQQTSIGMGFLGVNSYTYKKVERVKLQIQYLLFYGHNKIKNVF